MGASRRGASAGREFELSNAVGSFFDVLVRVVTRPAGFFAGVPRNGSLINPLIFALVCVEVGVVLAGIFGLAGAEVSRGLGISERGINFGAPIEVGRYLSFAEFVGSVVLAPIGAAIYLLISTVILHLLVVIFVGGRNSGFGATFRVASYTSVTNLVGWIPVIGPIASLYGVYLIFVGIRETHETTPRNAALVVLIPVAILLVLTLLGLIAAGLSAPPRGV